MKTKKSGELDCTVVHERAGEKLQDLPLPGSHLSSIFFFCFHWGKNKLIHEKWCEQQKEEKRRLTFERIMGFVLEYNKEIW